MSHLVPGGEYRVAMASKHPPPTPPPLPARTSSLLKLGRSSKPKDIQRPPQIFQPGSIFSQRAIPVHGEAPERGQVPDSDLPDPIRVDRAFYGYRPRSEGPSRLQELTLSPPPPPTPRKDTPPQEKKKLHRRITDTKSSPIKPSSTAFVKPLPKRLDTLKVECDTLHLYCACNNRAEVSPGLYAKLHFGDENDPDDPIRDLDLSGLDLKKPGGLGIFGLEPQTPTSVLERDQLLTRADKAHAILRDPKLLDQVIAKEHKLLLESEAKKRVEYERRESLDREAERQAIARLIEEERRVYLAEEENRKRQEQEERDAKTAEEKRKQQLEDENTKLKAEVEELRQLKEESEQLRKLKDENDQLKEYKRKSEETQQKQPNMVFEGGTAYPESDADDEYERSVHDNSPVLDTDGDETESEGSGGQTSNEHTPTTYGRMGRDRDSLPEAIITEWNADECADFLASLGLGQYADQFLGMSQLSHRTMLVSGTRDRGQEQG